MLNFIKKQSVGFYIAIIAIIFQIVALSLYCANATCGYYMDQNSTIVAFGVLSILVTAGVVAAIELLGEKYHISVLLLAVPVFLSVSFGMIVSARAETMAWVLASNLEAGNVVAQAAVQQAITCLIIYGIAIICTVVATFFKQVKEKKD